MNVLNKKEAAFREQDNRVLEEDEPIEGQPELPSIRARQRKVVARKTVGTTRRNKGKRKKVKRKRTVKAKTKKGSRKESRAFREKEPKLHLRYVEPLIMDEEPPPPKKPSTSTKKVVKKEEKQFSLERLMDTMELPPQTAGVSRILKRPKTDSVWTREEALRSGRSV